LAYRRYDNLPLAKNISFWQEWLRQSRRTLLELSETPRWQITPHPAPIPRVTLHIALQSRFRRFIWLCRYPIVNEHSGVIANSDIRAAKTAAQLGGRLGAVYSKQWILGYHKYKAFQLSYSSFLQSEDLLPYNMACII
jgi:hypothetical protein